MAKRRPDPAAEGPLPGVPPIELVAHRARPGDLFEFKGTAIEAVDQFWAWGFGNLVANTTRGVLAEYIVGMALGVVGDHRDPWAPFDLEYRGAGIEVKASAYLQAWQQPRLSTIRFDIAAHLPDNTLPGAVREPARPALIYVFCLLESQDPRNVDPLDLGQWSYRVVATRQLPVDQRSLGLGAVNELSGGHVDWSSLRAAVDRVLESLESNLAAP